jgi:regulator of cell morphogenesis and NO signaling
MSTLTTELTVGELAARFPASLRIFEKLGIDYCCGGNVPFDRACQERHLDPAAVLAEIEGAGAPAVPQTDWTSAPLGSLIDHIPST